MKSVFIAAVLVLCMGFNSKLFPFVSEDPSMGDRGLFLGVGASNFVGSSFSQASNKFIPGITLGFCQEFRFRSNFNLQTGLMFSSKGSRLDAVGDLYLHQFITYLELPVRAAWTILQKEKAQIFLSAGTYLGLKILAFNEVGFPEEIKGFDVGLDLGAGVKFQKLSFRLEVKQGFLNLDQSNTGLKYRNQSLFMVMGMLF